MSNRALAILAVVAAIVVVLLVVQHQFEKPAASRSRAAGPLIQGLDVEKIAAIQIGPPGKAFKLVRQGDHFVVPDKDNYPAATGKINRLITSCLDVTTLELITSNPANFDELNVTEEKAADVVKFLDAAEKVITGIIVGKKQPQTNARYVRLVTSNDVYTAQKVPSVRDSAIDYIDKELVNIDREDIVRVTVAGPNTNYTLRVDPNDSDRITLEPLAPDEKLKDVEAKSVLGALSYFSFTDVRRESSFEPGKLTFNYSYTAELKDSTVYTFKLAKTDGKTYVTCRIDTAADLDKASQFTNKHHGWVYEIASWKADKLTKKLADLVEKQEEPEQETADEGEAAGAEPQGAPAEASREESEPAADANSAGTSPAEAGIAGSNSGDTAVTESPPAK